MALSWRGESTQLQPPGMDVASSCVLTVHARWACDGAVVTGAPPALASLMPLFKDAAMSMSLLLIIVLIILLIGALPTWPYSRSWGYRPMGGLGIIVIIVIVLLLLGVF
jgi:hypothetical protein